MSLTNWQASLGIILKEEGGNDDDPRDPGGRTSRGIIQREWDVFRANNPGRPADVWKASDDDVATIYHLQYWEPYCDKLPSGVDLVFFNASVNSGLKQATKELQRGLGNIKDDGMMGMLTFNAVAACTDISGLIQRMCEKRRDFYKALSTFPTFGKGWLARTDRIEQAAISMVRVSTVQAETVSKAYPDIDSKPALPEITVSPKASGDDADETTLSPESSGTVSAGSGTVAGALSQIQTQLTPFADTIKVVQYILITVAIAGVIYMTYGIIKRNRASKAVAQ